MVIRHWPIEKVKATLRRLTGVAEIHATQFAPEDPTQVRGGRSPVALILSAGFRLGTLMLWLTYFMGVLVFYLITSWMPTLIKDSGITLQAASLVAALFPLGGALGAILCGWLMDRLNPHRVIAFAYLATGVLIWALGQVLGHATYLPVLTFGSGFFMGAALVSMPALAASYYPTQGRASGVAWMLGIGRLGGILGAVLGGVLLQIGLDTASILGVLAIPAFIAAAAVVAKDRARTRKPAPAISLERFT